MIRKIQDQTATYYREGESQPVAVIREDLSQGTVTLYLQGSFGSDMAHELGDELEALASVDLSLVLDLGSVTYLAAYTLEQLLTAQLTIDRHRRRMVLRHIPYPIQERLNETGFYEMLQIETEGAH